MNVTQISRLGLYSPGVCIGETPDAGTGRSYPVSPLRAFVMMLLPRGMQARLRARREERVLAAEIARLEALADHLLDDIAVSRDGAGRFVLETGHGTRVPLLRADAAGRG